MSSPVRFGSANQDGLIATETLLTYAVYREHGVLAFRLDGCKPHAGTLGGFPNSRVNLVRLHEQSHEMSYDELRVVAKLRQDTSPLMGAAAGLLDGRTRRPDGEEGHELDAFEVDFGNSKVMICVSRSVESGPSVATPST